MPAKVRGKKKDQVRLRSPLERRIKDYSLAAVGIGAAAFAPSASAAVVTTGVINHNVLANGGYEVTFGSHKVIDIVNASNPKVFSVYASDRTNTARGFALAAPKNEVSPVNAGQNVPGTLAEFSSSAVLVSSTFKGNQWTGFLGNTKYLGFSFGTGANVHYGWVQLNITQSGGPHTAYTVTVVQAAYETIAGKPLAAGATSDLPTTPAPNSLWLMALGAAGLAGLEVMRRRRRA
jgi:MYXO-CTERM domain-containing protein